MATHDFGSIQTVIDGVAERVKQGAERVKRKAGLVIDQALVFSTPVDKGIARSNWRVAIGSDEKGTFPAYAPGENLGLSEQQNAQAAIQQGQVAIGSSTPGTSIFISNNLPYIGKLDDGSSPQASPGFILASVTAAVSAVQGEKILGNGRGRAE